MTTKHIPPPSHSTTVLTSLPSLPLLNPSIRYSPSQTTVVLHPLPSQVHLVSGGGSGHEGAHAAFVGKGILSGSVCGKVFASPSAGQVGSVLEVVGGDEGVLIVVMNYTGDVLQFGLAKERWTAEHGEGVRMLVVGDDVAVPRSQIKLTGRRGLAGTVLVNKIAGHLAASGASLDEVEHIAKIIASSSGTIGVGLDHCHVPGTDVPKESFLKADEGEMGMGIHNEPGVKRLIPVPPVDSLVKEMLDSIIDTTDPERSFVPFANDGTDSVILLVNNLGGLSALELGMVVTEACGQLHRRGILIERVLAGAYMTSLNLPGFSITLVLLPPAPVKPTTFESKFVFNSDLILECLDGPAEAIGWGYHYKGRPTHFDYAEEEMEKKGSKVGKKEEVPGPAPIDPKVFLAAIDRGMEALLAAEPEITRYDTVAGDGDAGTTLSAGANAILTALAKDQISSTNLTSAFLTISECVADSMGGTSGGLYAIFISALAIAFKESKAEVATVEVWSKGLETALNTLYTYTLARPPSRTLVDPLSSFILTLSGTSSLPQSFAAAQEAAEATEYLDAVAGRAVYVDKERLREEGARDAGAWGVWKFLEGVQQVLNQ